MDPCHDLNEASQFDEGSFTKRNVFRAVQGFNFAIEFRVILHRQGYL